MTGDDHGSFYTASATANRFSDALAASPSGCSVANWQCVRSTAYLFPNIIATNTLTNAQVAAYVAQGFEIGVHVDSATDCQDWTTSALSAQYTNYLASFASEFPSLPAPQTHRMHCVSWSDYDSQPTIELQNGIRLDTTYYYWPSTWINNLPGMFTGSGMPMRFADRNGNLINVYQATTQMTDESGQTYPLNINTLLDNALSGSAYYGVFTANMHNDQGSYPGPGWNSIVASAQARGVPVVTSLQMLQWLDGRNGSSFASLAWSGNVLSFSITVGANANNLTAMLPSNAGTLGLTGITLNGNPVSYQLQITKGIQYAVFAASAGNYLATYGGSPLFSISGAISPAAAASGTTVTAAGPVTVTASVDNYGNYSLNGLPSGSYVITPSDSGFTFTPSSQAVTVSGANVAAVNFNAGQICPCSLWNNNTIPGTPSFNDPSPAELGVTFYSDVAGTISAVRFYKGSSNTGTHIGNLWSNTGANLASATFSNETATGWQQVNFATPVPITADTTYVASYYTPTGNYAADNDYFATGYDNTPLHAPQNGALSANGLYVYDANAFPTNTYESTNYWVDIVFSPTGTYSISGTISGAGGNGATVSLMGPSSATTTADASGNYSFNGLANGYYTITPSNSGFTFTPASQNATVNNASVAAVNFSTGSSSVHPATYSISGTISGAGGAGATVNLSGPSIAATTADAFGNYTFTGMANGSYTVTPSNSGFTFTPASQPATVSGASVTGINFSTVTYSISGTISGAGGNGATVTLSGASSATVTASATGTYTFTNLANGSYTVTASNSGFTFTSASQPATVSNASVSGINFSTVTYSISGTISGAGGNGATVTLSGASSATVTASATGTYTFSNLTNGSYTVTASKSGFSFTPASQGATVSNASVTGINFSTVAYSISGTISGAGGNGATVTLSGTSSATVTASATGTYTFSNLANGSYTLTASNSGFTFTPASQSATVSNASVTGINFSTVTYSISGTISGAGGNGATVTLSGASSATVTASTTGTYTFSNLTNGSYTVTPSKSGFSFTPASQAATVSSASVTGINFSTGTYSISGTISGAGGNGATVTLSGASSATVTASATGTASSATITASTTGTASSATVTASATGTYTFSNLANGSYTVTASKSGFTFTPASQAATVNNASVSGINFSTVTYSISGTISGAGGNGATVTLSGASSATATASSTGTYTFSNLANGSYTVAPSKSGFTFTPASQAATVSNASVPGINFSTVTVTYSISGTISGTAGNGATVTLSGASSATVTGSATGTYTFSNLANGSYTVTPSKSGFIFTPANKAVTVSSANVTAINFTSTAQLAIDQIASGNQTISTNHSWSGKNITVTSTFSTTKTNELLLAFVSTDDGGPFMWGGPGSYPGDAVSSVTGGNLTWSLVKRTNTQEGSAEIWRAFSATTLSNISVTANLPRGVAATITVVTFTGVDTTGTGGSGAIGATGTANSSRGTPAASLTTTRNNSWVFGVANAAANTTSWTLGSNQVMVSEYAGSGSGWGGWSGGFTGWVQRQNGTTPTAGTVVSINDTTPTNDQYNLSICEVLPAQ
ncbi:MAG: carboxypeptidase regulatory-like domain-containing protein [Terriglobales bacterium]